MQKQLKNFIKFFIASFGKHRWPTRKPSLTILAYHRILPKSDARYSLEQPTMVVTPETFKKNIAWASRYFKFIKLGEWLKMCKHHSAPPGKYCAITFDDGWVDNLEYALPILEKYSVPATIFCVSKMISGRVNYWPGLVSRLIIELSKSSYNNYIKMPECAWLANACAKFSINWEKPNTNDLDKIVESLKIYKDLEILNFIDETKAKVNLRYTENRQVLNVEEIKLMTRTGLIDIGSHTINHIRFTDSTPSEILQHEIIKSKEIITSLIGENVDVFCYPNGYHPKNAVAISSKYYCGACTLEKGWNYCDTDFSTLRRIGFHEEVAANKAHFIARLSGWI